MAKKTEDSQEIKHKNEQTYLGSMYGKWICNKQGKFFLTVLFSLDERFWLLF